jgi:uncharacterized protein (TIGR02147 family)
MEQCYRELLKDQLSKRCLKNSSYSLRSFAKDLDMPASTLSHVLNGKRQLDYERANQMVSKLRLSKEQSHQFLSSVFEQQCPDYQMLNDDCLDLVSDPKYLILLNLIELDDFVNDHDWIATKMQITSDEVDTLITNLMQQGLIAITEDTIIRTGKSIMTPVGRYSHSQKEFHKSVLKQAMNSLDKYQRDERYLTCITMAINKKNLALATKELAKTREKLGKLLEDGPRDEVYHLELGLFPSI